MVYQQFINYPNFTVFENIASPLKIIGVRPDEIKGRGKVVEELEKNEAIDKKLLRYMTVKVKDFDLDTNYFAKREDGEKFEKKEITPN